MRTTCLLLSVAWISCASPRATPEPTTPSHRAVAKPEPSATPPVAAAPDSEESADERAKRLAAELESMDMKAIGAVGSSNPAVGDAASRFLTSANSDDDSGARASCTAECWSKECQSFARQAGKKFQARLSGAPRENGDHAVVGVDVICPGDRKCDFVHLLMARSQGQWLVSDVTEDDAKAKAWVP